MSRKLSFDNEAMNELYEGVSKLAKVVRVTLGPKGRNVLLPREYGSPHGTKDGISAAKEVFSTNPIHQMAMDLVKEAANNTLENAGDGTTSTTVLTHAVLTEGMRQLNTTYMPFKYYLKHVWDPKTYPTPKPGSNAMDIKRGIDLASELIIEKLKEVAKPIKSSEDVFNVAKISGNNDDEIGNLIRKAIDLVGRKGVIQSEDSPTSTSDVNLVKGLQLDRGFISNDFATDLNKSFAEYDEPYYFLYNGKLDSVQELLRAVEITAQAEKPLIIIADDYDTNVMNFLLRNRLQAGFKLVALKTPGMGDQKFQLLKDLASLTGCQTLNPNISESLSTINMSHLGTSKKIKITKSNTIIISDELHSDAVNDRITLLREEISQCEIEGIKVKLENRIAQLEGKLAIISIGAATEAALKEKKDRLDDALSATKSALQEGVVPGAGMTLLRISEYNKGYKPSKNEDINKGYQAVMEAIRYPAIAILENAGLSYTLILKRLIGSLNMNEGFNPITESYVDLMKEGIIDPVKVTRLAVKNACSIAGMILTTGCVISKLPKNE